MGVAAAAEVVVVVVAEVVVGSGNRLRSGNWIREPISCFSRERKRR